MSVTVPAPFTSSSAAIVPLRSHVGGCVLTSDDPEYDDARLLWNRAFQVRPAVIVQAKSADDVAAAVRFAAEQGLGVAVQATGHGLTAACDGAVLVTTGAMDAFVVDPHARTARVEAGVQWGPVLAEAQRHGLSPLAGSAPHVGAVGYTLGGGMGWLARKYGLSSSRVRAFEVVTADGEIRRTSADEDPGLFWALRGAGVGGFGIVTAMEIELVPVADVYAGNLLYPVELAGEIFDRFRSWVRDVPDELTSAVAIMNYPPIDVVPEPLRGRSFAIVRGCWCGPLEEGEQLLRFWRDWREPAIDLFGPMPFARMADISQDPVDPLPALATTDSFDALEPAVAETLIRHTLPSDGPPPLLFTEVRHCGGALATSDLPGGPGLRDVGFLSHTIGLVDPTDPARVERAGNLLRGELAAHRRRHAYLNFLDGDDRRERTVEAFDGDELARLRAVKQAVDPAGRLRFGLPL